jgi:hypothetical protein
MTIVRFNLQSDGEETDSDCEPVLKKRSECERVGEETASECDQVPSRQEREMCHANLVRSITGWIMRAPIPQLDQCRQQRRYIQTLYMRRFGQDHGLNWCRLKTDFSCPLAREARRSSVLCQSMAELIIQIQNTSQTDHTEWLFPLIVRLMIDMLIVSIHAGQSKEKAVRLIQTICLRMVEYHHRFGGDLLESIFGLKQNDQRWAALFN